MPVTIALAIGFDPWLVESQRTAWRSAGCFVTGVNSVGEAIEQLRCGDFDLILLDPSIPPASRDQVTALVRACGSLIPVVSITDVSSSEHTVAASPAERNHDALLQRILGLLTTRKRPLPERFSPANQQRKCA
jgi:DNA-binding response OmpR family regulator